ncbi:hypothetical protein BHE74_00039247 [Ensete ventricosum]|nr:hypothetical protein BHE74_00039247 [Ensete ventricosum]
MAFGGSKADTSLFEGDLQCLLRTPTLSGSSSERDVADLCLRKRRWGVLVETIESLLMSYYPWRWHRHVRRWPGSPLPFGGMVPPRVYRSSLY